jgi:uncharacterized protein involved in response to NO
MKFGLALSVKILFLLLALVLCGFLSTAQKSSTGDHPIAINTLPQ